jgi:hypothetical protein
MFKDSDGQHDGKFFKTMKQDNKYIKQTEPDYKAGKKSRGSGYIKLFYQKARSVNLFYAFTGIMQMLLGFLVTIISLLHLVQPLWLAAFLSLLGCVVTMLGLYQLYDTLKQGEDARDLAKNAIQRAIRDRN